MTETTPADLMCFVSKAAMRELLREVVRAEIEPLISAIRAGKAATESPTLMTAKDVQALLRIDERTLRRATREGAVPPPIHIGGRMIRWRRGDLERWLESGARPQKKTFHARRKAGSCVSEQTGGPSP